MAIALAVLLGAAAAAIWIDPPPPSESAPARAAVEMLTVLVAALAACLMLGRARAGGRGRDLALASGVALFAVVEGGCSLLPAITSHESGGALLGAEAIARLLVAVVLVVASLTPAPLLDHAGRRTGYAIGAALLAVAAALVLLAIPGLDPPSQPAASRPAWQTATQLAAALAAVIAAAAFARRSARNGGGELDAWIAMAVVLLGGAQLAAALGPVAAPDHVTTGILLRPAAAIVLLAGALAQLGTYPSALTRRAVAQERRRIARDLHDGLAQELAYIAAHAPRMAARSGDPVAAGLAEAAAFALDHSRLVIAGLAQEPGEPLGPALAHAAERIASRAGRVVRADLQAGVDVEPAVRGDLLRIVMEATTNAVRHSGASEVSLSLTGGEAVVLRIADDGVGFGVDDVAPRSYSGFGLRSMQERAERAGGRLRVRSRPGGGTEVEVRIA
ncbi:MAG TPA: ATP-binding protein [Solirubrobacteraceae bacterium]|nr:ATP-binding protein [Solirubrobacteraceae bacterium]